MRSEIPSYSTVECAVSHVSESDKLKIFFDEMRKTSGTTFGFSPLLFEYINDKMGKKHLDFCHFYPSQHHFISFINTEMRLRLIFLGMKFNNKTFLATTSSARFVCGTQRQS